MNTEIYQIIDEYMEWGRPGVGMVRKYDSNDASLCVQKMVKKGDFDSFISHVWTTVGLNGINYVKYLFNPGNFFTAMASWLRSK